MVYNLHSSHYFPFALAMAFIPTALVFSFLSAVSTLAIKPRYPGWKVQASSFLGGEPLGGASPPPLGEGVIFTPKQMGRCEPDSMWLPIQGKDSECVSFQDLGSSYFFKKIEM